VSQVPALADDAAHKQTTALLLPSRLLVSESTLEAPPADETASPDPSPAPTPWTLRAFVRGHPWWTTALGLVLVSAILLLWAGTRPGFDPYGWLVWGYQTLHLSLDLGGAPSWKPLPYLFTVPYALVGHYALTLWMVSAVAISLGGAIFAGRIAYRLTGPGPDRQRGPDRESGPGHEPGPSLDRERRYAAIVAAVFAGLAVLGMEDYTHDILSVQSDPMIVAFVLAAVDSHLGGHPRWAFAFGVLASLGRPEAWPFTGLYAIWAWRSIPSMRWLIYAGLALIPLMWFGIPVLSGNPANVAGNLALKSPRELHQNKILGTLGRFTELEYLPVWLAALFAVAWAFVRRNYLVLILAAGVVAWLVVEIAFALHGFPALSRYVMPAAGVAIVLAGVGVGWALYEVPRIIRGVPRWAGVPVVVVLLASLVPGAMARVRAERSDLRHERGRTHEIALLKTTIDALGGYQHIRRCGEPGTDVEYVSALAWFVKMDVGFVGHLPKVELRKKYPIVLFTPLVHGGWRALPWHTLSSKQARCRGLKATLVVKPHHPRGVLIRRR